ncbi:hypothetical protein C8J57DRAFT_1223156 [Mycena rebaudengoi]|nr:hypothetical protein C8J57DRAFT_1223156 [Mycena rebaudengoi]
MFIAEAVALSVVAPDVPKENVTIRDYDKSSPTVVWDEATAVFAFALPPKCEEHSESPCLCWVGPFLHDAAKDFDGATLGTKKLFRAYLLCMKGDASMKDDVEGDENGMDVDHLDRFTENDDGDEVSSQEPSEDEEEEDDDDDMDYVQSGAGDSDNEPIMAEAGKPFSLLQSVERQLTPATPPPPSDDVLETFNTPRQSASPTPAPQPPAPQAAWSQRLPGPLVDADDALASISAIVTHYKDLQAALDDAAENMNTLREEITLGKTEFKSLETQLEVLKIDCATHERRVDELNGICGDREAKIVALEMELADARKHVEKIRESLAWLPTGPSQSPPSERARQD